MIIIDNLTVGYHAWITDDLLVLFVLGRPNTLRLYSVSDKKDLILAENIGRSLHRIPGTNDISFIDKQGAEWQIKRYNSKNGTIETVTPTLPNREDMAWTTDGKILMSDGKKLFFVNPGEHSSWREATLPKMIAPQGISRLAINTTLSKIAIVVDEAKN